MLDWIPRARSWLATTVRWWLRQLDRLRGAARPRRGVGGLPVPGGGFAFLVWAPTARAVEVTGDFAAAPDGQWRTGAHPLGWAGDGYWRGIVAEACPGQRYKFLVTARDGRRLWRVDPAARDTDGRVHVALPPWCVVLLGLE
jgi:1,4-alpha-glucan branching enzyme